MKVGDARPALQSVRLRCSRRDVAARAGVLSEFAARSEFSARRSTGLIGSPIPPCRWPFPRLRGFPAAGRVGDVKLPVHTLFGFRVPPESYSAQPSPPAAAGELLSWAFVPFSTSGIGGPLSRALPPPATFRPQGLVTLSAVYALQARAGFVSHRQRSWDSPFGAFSSRKVSAAFPRGLTHMPFLPPVIPAAIGDWAGPADRGFWALTLPGVPRARCRVSASNAGCSLGLCPLRAFQQEPCPSSRPGSSHALRCAHPKDGCCRRLGVSLGSCLVLPGRPQ